MDRNQRGIEAKRLAVGFDRLLETRLARVDHSQVAVGFGGSRREFEESKVLSFGAFEIACVLSGLRALEMLPRRLRRILKAANEYQQRPAGHCRNSGIKLVHVFTKQTFRVLEEQLQRHLNLARVARGRKLAARPARGRRHGAIGVCRRDARVDAEPLQMVEDVKKLGTVLQPGPLGELEVLE